MSELKMKMYILIPEDIPLGHAINSAAHASLACYLQYEKDADVRWWRDESFKKVTVKVRTQCLNLCLHAQRQASGSHHSSTISRTLRTQ